MSQNNNLSIDEILREAQEVLSSISGDSVSGESAEAQQDDVKTYVPQKKSRPETNEQTKPEKSEDAEDIKEFRPDKEKPRRESEPKPKQTAKSAQQKTKAIPPIRHETAASDKTMRVPQKKSEKSRFFKKYSSDEEYGSTPPQIIEKAATIRSKSRFDKTSDLQEIPTILAVEELDKTRRVLSSQQDSAPAQETEEYDSSDQIRLSGFDDEMDEVPDIDEELAEEQLRRRREEKVSKFRLFAQEELPGDEKGTAQKITQGDYRDRSERTLTMERLFKMKTNAQVQVCFTIVFGALLFAVTLLHGSGHMPSFLNNDFAYCLAVNILYGLALITNIVSLLHGLNLKKGINFDFPVTVSSLVVLGHCICAAAGVDLASHGGSLLASAAVFGLFMSGVGKYRTLVRVIRNFEYLTNSSDKYTVEDIVNEVDAKIISKNMLDGNPYLKYSVKTDFPTSFFEISFANEPADKIAKILFPVLFGFNAALFAVYGIVYSDWLSAFSIITAGLVISCPVVTLCATNNALCDMSKVLEKRGAMICGYEGAHYIHNSNAIVMEASELFGPRSCSFHGYKTFNGAKIDDALLQTAAVIIQTKSPLAAVFDSVIVGRNSILPTAEGIIYEDKMGTSAWIYQKKVLVGNRDLLIRHGVSVPKIEYEKKYTRKGRKALYLAVAGKISAMFIVSYTADPALKKSLKRLEKSGMTVILRSCDPYINEESVTKIFDLPEGYIRVMTASNGRSFEKYSDAVAEKSPAYAVHNGTTNAFRSSVLGSDKLVVTEKIITALASFGSAIGFGVIALLSFANGLSQLNAVNIIIFQALWSLFVLIITKLRKNGI